MIQILPCAWNSFLDLAGGSRVFVSRGILINVSLHRVIVHYYRYLAKTAEITILELTAN